MPEDPDKGGSSTGRRRNSSILGRGLQLRGGEEETAELNQFCAGWRTAVYLIGAAHTRFFFSVKTDTRHPQPRDTNTATDTDENRDSCAGSEK